MLKRSFQLAFSMKLTEENKLQFLEWLADNHAGALRLHSSVHTRNPWWEHRAPYPLSACAILSTSWILKLLVEWAKQPGQAGIGAYEGDPGTHKALTIFLRHDSLVFV